MEIGESEVRHLETSRSQVEEEESAHETQEEDEKVEEQFKHMSDRLNDMMSQSEIEKRVYMETSNLEHLASNKSSFNKDLRLQTFDGDLNKSTHSLPASRKNIHKENSHRELRNSGEKLVEELNKENLVVIPTVNLPIK